MADDVTLPGTGAVIATDEVGGRQYQLVKLAVGGDGLAAIASASNPIPVATPRGGPTDRSGTIAAGGTAQQLMAANASRLGFAVQNVSAEDLWINDLGAAAASQPSLLLVAGAYYETPPGYGSSGSVSIFGATTGQAFSAREW